MGKNYMATIETKRPNEEATDDVIRKLKEWGLYKYGEQEVRDGYNARVAVFEEGLKVGPGEAAPKMLPGLVNTGIDLISKEHWKRVPPGKAIACAFAGTVWKVAIVEKLVDGEVTIQELKRKVMDGVAKNHNSESFAKLMAAEIDAAVAAHEEIDVSGIRAIGIALGFAQDNLKTDLGIDAKLTNHSNSKGWLFSDINPNARPSLGQSLLRQLAERFHDWNSVKSFAFRNDTQGVAEDGQTFEEFVLALGFVFGTGDNGARGATNLELGKMPIEDNVILTRMSKLGKLPMPPIQEYLMGGEYIKLRAAAAVDLLGENHLFDQAKEIVQAILTSKNPAVMSDLVIALDIEEVQKILEVRIKDPDTVTKLRFICETALAQAGQVMAMNMMAVVEAAGYSKDQEAVIPVEGTVFWNGYGVLPAVNAAKDQIFPGNKLSFKEAIGLRGVGVVALAQTLR